ncbi:hypothetical protein [Methylobacterium sp. D54C]
MLTNADGPVGAADFYEASELRLGVYVSWTPGDIGLFGSAELAVAALDLGNCDVEDVTAAVDALPSGRGVGVSPVIAPGLSCASRGSSGLGTARRDVVRPVWGRGRRFGETSR